MTSYNRRELPHPTLNPGGDDYQTHIRFGAALQTIRLNAQAREITIAVKYELNSPVLTSLIDEGQAHYHSLTQCLSTRLRESHRSSDAAHTIHLDANKYHGEVFLRPFIIAATDIPAISNRDWDPVIRELLPQGASVPAGAILAIANEKAFNLDMTEEQESYIDIIPSEDVEPKRFKISLSDERIGILINPDDRPDIERIRQDQDQIQKLFPSMYLNAIEQAVRYHQKDEHQGKRWSRRIADKLAEYNIPVDDKEVLEANSLYYAQQIMENPLARITAPSENSHASEE